MQECPVCAEMFATDFIEVHASACGERYPFIFSLNGNCLTLCASVTQKEFYVARAGNQVRLESTVSEEEQASIPRPSGTCATDRDGM